MAANPHHYTLALNWTGNQGSGTSGYRAYQRSYDLSAADKPTLYGSADPTFRGDPTRWNPEEMLLGALSSCHMLSYLHVCADAGIVVLEYRDQPQGEMLLEVGGSGHFTQVTLHPQVVIASDSDAEKAEILHHLAHEKCFIANSVNFPVACKPQISVQAAERVFSLGA